AAAAAGVRDWLSVYRLSESDLRAQDLTALQTALQGKDLSALDKYAAQLPAMVKAKQAESFDDPSERLAEAKAWLENRTGLPSSSFRDEDIQTVANALYGATDTAALEAFVSDLPKFLEAKQAEAFDEPSERLAEAKAWLENRTGLPSSAFRDEDVQTLANALWGASDL
ncbi:MAG: hypothetical protein AAB368_16995, partial [bacterium]